jgi:hypothetical protein
VSVVMSVCDSKEQIRQTNVSQSGAFLEIKQQQWETAGVGRVFEGRPAS